MKKFAPFLLYFALVGCSGGTAPSQTTGSAVFRIEWPERTRLIPQYTDSIRIGLVDPKTEKEFNQVTVTRPASGTFSAVTITDLPLGMVRNVVNAYPPRNIVGVPQSFSPRPIAFGQGEVEIKGDKPAEITITLNSTIAIMDQVPTKPKENSDPFYRPVMEVNVGQTLPLIATPKDALGGEILIRPGSLRWASESPDAISVSQAGVVTGAKEGRSIITVTEPDSGKQAQWEVFASTPGGVGGGPCSNCPF